MNCSSLMEIDEALFRIVDKIQILHVAENVDAIRPQ